MDLVVAPRTWHRQTQFIEPEHNKRARPVGAGLPANAVTKAVQVRRQAGSYGCSSGPVGEVMAPPCKATAKECTSMSLF